MPPRIPYIGPDGPDPELDPIYAQEFARQYVPVTPANIQQAPGARFLGVNLNGGGLDEAARGVLAALSEAPSRGNFGTGLASGFASGLARGRVNKADQRAAANNAELKRVAGEQEAQRKTATDFARELARHRWQMQRDAQQAALRAPARSERRFPLTPSLRAQLKANNIFVPDEATDIPESVAFRDKPQGNPALDEIRAARLQQERDAEASRLSSIESTAQGIADYSIDPDRVPRDKNFRDIENRANQILKEKGSPYTLQQLQALKLNARKFMENENGARFIALRTSMPTFADHLSDFERFNTEFDKAYKRLPFWQANQGIIAAAKNGYLGEKAAFAASQLETNRPIVAKELSMLLAYPYAPFKESDEQANNIISNFWNPRQQKGALGAVKSIVRSRVKNVMAQTPYAGGVKNPYLLDPSPLFIFGEQFPSPKGGAMEPKPGKTLADQYGGN